MAIRFYKNEYLIAVYDTEDNLVGVCDNVKEFAKMYDKDELIAGNIISRISKGQRQTFYHGDRQLTIFLIPLDPEELQELQKEEGKHNESNPGKSITS